MSNSPSPKNSALIKHRSFLISRMFFLQLVAMSIIALAVGITGIYLFRSYVYDRISSSSNIIAESIVNYCIAASNKSGRASEETISDEYIEYIIDKSGAETGMSVFIFDGNGQCLLCSENSEMSVSETKLSGSVLKAIKKDGEYISDAGSVMNTGFSKPAISKGITFSVTEKDGRETKYFLFTSTYSDSIETFIRIILIVGILVVAVMLLFYTVFIHRFIAKYIAQPETVISRCIRQYAQGDFSEKYDPESLNDSYHKETLASLNQIAENLKTTNEQQAQFVSNVSHELRTPMTIISGYINGILDGTVPKEKRTEYLYIVSQEMQRLKILVSSMLNLTKYDNGTIQIKREEFVINDLIFRTLLMFENRLEKRNITVEGLDCDSVLVYGDSDLIGQVVYNLTENAVKFVDTGGRITIRLEETKEASIFAIGNTGPGISKEELPKIFGRFYKSDFSRSQDKTGLGLGLDIIRKILRLHDAQISVSSEENVFTEFVVSFPKKDETLE
ncbi:MAG: sensor histidine kinase [Ruminococcus sp.]